MALKIDVKVEGKLTCAFKNDMRNFANFHRQKNFRKQNDGTKSKLKFKSTRLTRCSVKALFYIENK